MSNEIARLVIELIKAWNDHDIDRIVAFYAPDYEGTDVAQATPQYGPEAVRQSMARYLRAFPDLHFSAEEVVVQDNRVVFAWTARGTHQGKLMNIPATGREIAVRGMSLFTLEGDKIQRSSHVWDVAGLLRAIGLLPEL